MHPDDANTRSERAPSVSGSQGSAPVVVPRCPGRRPRHWPLPTRIICATLNLLLKYQDVIVAIYKRRQMKYLKQASETLAKTPEKPLHTYATSE